MHPVCGFSFSRGSPHILIRNCSPVAAWVHTLPFCQLCARSPLVPPCSGLPARFRLAPRVQATMAAFNSGAIANLSPAAITSGNLALDPPGGMYHTSGRAQYSGFYGFDGGNQVA